MTTKLREKPILFSGPMIRAILAGKTQTRRVVKPQPELNGTIHDRIPAWWWPTKASEAGYIHTDESSLRRIMEGDCPYQVGMNLWVREAWRAHVDGGTLLLNYRADDTVREFQLADIAKPRDSLLRWTWKPPMHMPRFACRISLRLTGVRVERLQEISEADAQAEGVEEIDNPDYDSDDPCDDRPTSYIAAFAELWDEINGKRAKGHYCWESNPFCWVLAFERVEADWPCIANARTNPHRA